jgi:hypothetical protein
VDSLKDVELQNVYSPERKLRVFLNLNNYAYIFHKFHIINIALIQI